MTDKKNIAQEPEANEPLHRVVGAWEQYGKKILIGVAAVVVVAGGIFGYKYLVSEPKEKEA
ncbi:MAG TPA: hypothetical protein VLD19_03280, partial [Chitinophagaceae bacterium]|nr:hypothetical protein [Chitinophagaceae bacterium]